MLRRIRFTSADLLFLLLIFHLIGNIIWIRLNNAPPSWDDGYNTMRSLDYMHFYENLLLGRVDVNAFKTAFIDYYGPLVRLITGFFMLIVAPHVKLAQFIATPFFLGTIYVTYLLGKNLYKSEWIGLMAAFLFSFFQVVYNDSRWLLLDIPMTFFTLLSFYFFIRSNFFQSRKYSILSFIVVVLVVYTKFQGILYLFIPYLWGLIVVIKNRHYLRLANIVIGALILFIPLLSYVIPSIEKIKVYYGLAVPGEPIVDPIPLLDPHTWTHHFKLFVNYEITFPIFVFFLISLYFLFKTLKTEKKFDFSFNSIETTHFKSENYINWFLIVNIIFYYFFFTIFPNKDMRFLFPVLPYVALIFAKGFANFWHRFRRSSREALVFIVFFNIIMYFILSFEIPLKKGRVYFVVLPLISDIALLNMKNYPVLTYDPNIWPQEQIIKDLRLISRGKEIEVVLVPNFEWFNDNNLAIYDRIFRTHNISTLRAGGKTRFESRVELETYMNEHSYFLTTPGEVGVFFQTDLEAFNQMRDLISEWLVQGKAQIIKSYALPNSHEIWLVKKVY